MSSAELNSYTLTYVVLHVCQEMSSVLFTFLSAYRTGTPSIPGLQMRGVRLAKLSHVLSIMQPEVVPESILLMPVPHGLPITFSVDL